MPYSPLGNVDFGGIAETLSALQRNPQVSRAAGTGAATFTGSVVYAVVLDVGTVQITDISTYGVAAPGISVPAGIPVPGYSAAGGSITVTPSSSNVHWCVVYK